MVGTCRSTERGSGGYGAALESDRFDVAAAIVINASSFVNGSDVTESRDLTLQSLISYISLRV